MFYFFGDKYSKDGSLYDQLIHKVSSRHIMMHNYYSKILTNSSRSLRLQLMKELEEQMRVEDVFSKFLEVGIEDVHKCRRSDADSCKDEYVPADFTCLRSLMKTYEDNCGPFTHYANNFIKYLVRECEQPTMHVEETH